ncbi:outer membrane protein [Labrys sp. La1]|uniref:outer membrane protein n=1 Tax=Labrys sp. La1 TaxID=3404917 RepID=UPI003EBFCE57
MRLRLALAALLASATPVLAADLGYATAEPIAPVAPYSWTGFYVGAHAGAAFGNAKITSSDGYRQGFNNVGFVGGLHAGYNYQFDNHIVVGLEGDIDYSSLSKTRHGIAAATPYAVRFKSEWQGSVRGRLGYAFDRFLPYLTAGVAFADEKYRVTVPAGVSSQSTTRVGWTVGAGLEYAIDENWSVRGEVRYSDFGKWRLRGNPSGKVRFNETTALLGVSYKF